MPADVCVIRGSLLVPPRTSADSEQVLKDVEFKRLVVARIAALCDKGMVERADLIDKVKKQEKDGELSEDQSRDEQDKVQKLTDKFIAELEKMLAQKETDILKV